MPARKEKAEGLTDTWGRQNRGHADKECENCGQTFRPKRSDSKYCSRPCTWANNGMHNKRPDGAETWWLNSRGYVEGRVWVDGRPRQVKQHRWVMEQHLGRVLEPQEDVHHKNGDITDNKLDNLQVILHGEHSRLHNESREYKRGYKLNLSDEERAKRAERLREMRRG